MAEEAPAIEDIRAAAKRIAGRIHRTPVMTSATLDGELGARVFFKCENLQKVGAFKARGATNAVFSLAATAARRGVSTHSSGNHGAALAFAAATRGIPCVVVIPHDAPPIKVAAVRGYGADVVTCPRARREETAARVRRERGSTEIHPYEDPRVVAGQGTAALELIEEVGPLDVVVAPVGGGGLLAGTTLATRALLPDCAVWGAEPERADDAFRSLESGVRQPGPSAPASICDGLLTGLGELAFDVLRRHGTRVVTVAEPEIVAATWWIFERMKLVVEPSGAVVLAALRRRRGDLRGLRIGAVLSGGNVDLRALPAPAAEPSAGYDGAVVG